MRIQITILCTKIMLFILTFNLNAQDLKNSNPKDSSLTTQKLAILDTLPKKVTEEFKRFDLDNNGYISHQEKNICIEKTLDFTDGFDSKTTYRLLEYMNGNLKDAPSFIAETTNKKESEIVNNYIPQSLQPIENKNFDFFQKHFQVGAQIIGLYQYSSGFKKALYDGDLSMPSKAGGESLCIFTVPVNMQFWKGSEFNFTMQYADGNGVGNGCGVSAYPNAYYGYPQNKPLVYKAQYRQNFVFDTSLTKRLQKINFTIGQLIIQEMFDCNPYSCDPAVDFLNLSHNMLSGWDASTTAYGYSYGLASSLVFKKSSLNFAAVTVNKYSGAPVTDWDISKAHSFNLQYAQQYNLFNKIGTIRLLGYYNSARSGLYSKYNMAYEPDDTLKQYGVAYFEDSLRTYRPKFGFGIDADMALTENIGLFARYSWNDDKTETYSYTEASQSINAGLLFNMSFIYRENDKFGICGSYGTISKNHQNFLKNGGSGLMLGDGNLNYAPEIAGEAFYSFSVLESLSLTLNYQYVLNAGYNKDRGNVGFYGFRFNLTL